MSMFGQFQVLMALLETQCDCCIVRVTVCVHVCVCVFAGTTVYACKKNRWVFVCVSCVCVCRDHISEYVGAVPTVDGLPETQCECCAVSVIVFFFVCVCVCGKPMCMPI